MKIIGVTDIHGSISAIERMTGILCEADLVLFAGDITHFGREAEAEQVMSFVVPKVSRCLAVSGNCDFPEVDAFLDRRGINLHARGMEIDGIGFVGLGGSLVTPFHTPNESSEEEMARWLDTGFAQLSPAIPWILVSHQPPHRTACDRLFSGDHVGSLSVRRFIEQNKPLICFTGHIHESAGMDRIGETHVINPGILRNGRYAYAEITDGVKAIEIRSIF